MQCASVIFADVYACIEICIFVISLELVVAVAGPDTVVDTMSTVIPLPGTPLHRADPTPGPVNLLKTSLTQPKSHKLFTTLIPVIY